MNFCDHLGRRIITESNGDGYFEEVDIDEDNIDDFPEDDENRIGIEYFNTVEFYLLCLR